LLVNLTITELLAKTASSEPVPGGGSISALNAAMAAALTEMVAGVTIGKKGYENVEEDMKNVARKASALRDKFTGEIDRDSDAYNQVVAAFKLPKATDAEKKRRAEAIQEGLKEATRVPLGVAKDAFALIDLVEIAVKKGNKNAVTDGAVAAMAARTAVLGALYNVKINLNSIKDANFVSQITAEIAELEVLVRNKENEIINAIQL
jgi:formiminotetrahydrofolate cyclodeaminase